MTSKIYRPEDKHPEPYQQDLNPDASKGVNWGLVGPHPEKNEPRTAKDVKELHDLLNEFPDDELERIPVLPTDSRLESKATYINLREANAQEFSAEGHEVVDKNDLVVPKSEVDYQLWNKLIEVISPSRTGTRAR
jgi:hypothetical protein